MPPTKTFNIDFISVILALIVKFLCWPMLKKHNHLFLTLMLIADIGVVSLSWLGAYYVRFNFFDAPFGTPPLAEYIKVTPAIVIIWAVALQVGGLYVQMRSDSRFHEFYRIFKTATISAVIMMAIAFLYRDFMYSRLVMMLFWGFSIITLIVSHSAVRTILRQLRERGHNLRYILIIGTGELGQRLVETVNDHPESGFVVVGMLADSDEEIGGKVNGAKIIGTIDDIKNILRQQTIDQIFIALPRHMDERLEHTLTAIGDETVDIKLAPDILQFIQLNGGVEDFDGIPLISLSESPMYGWNRVFKRIFDIIFSTLFIIIGSPLMLLVALAIKLESKGSLIFRQERMSLGGDSFTIYKFRSMRTDAEAETGAVWAAQDDPRRTRIGEFIRKTSIDELPQLFNVLRGDMSLVGPRPERPVFVEDFRHNIPQYMLRHKMKAGITGWAQVSGYRGNTSIEKRIEHDLYYIENWSLFLDLKILWLTIWKGFVNDHAY